jgi:phage baseplate assembly protein W
MSRVQTGAYHKRNLRWPLAWVGGGFDFVTLVARYESAIRHMMNTPHGSLYYAPDYGTMFHRLRTQSFPRKDLSPEGQGKLAVAVAHMRQSVSRYIPDVLIDKIFVEPDSEEQRLGLSCLWLLRNASASMHGDIAKPQKLTVLY